MYLGNGIPKFRVSEIKATELVTFSLDRLKTDALWFLPH